MDLLGTILNTMDGPPPASEKEKKEARGMVGVGVACDHVILCQI